MIHITPEERRKKFGKQVAWLRKTRPVTLPDVDEKSWRQKDLSKQCGINLETGELNVSEGQIQAIEQGKKVKLEPFLPYLADAFGLTEAERVEFWALAGYVYYHHPALYNLNEPDKWQQHQDLLAIPNPASVRTPMWDFLLMNALHRELWNVTDRTVDLLRKHSAGANLMALKFDPDLRGENTVDRNPNWEIETIWAFKLSTRNYMNTVRYRNLMKILMGIIPFKLAWLRASTYTAEDILEAKSSRKPKYELHHPEFGLLSVTSHRWTDMLKPDALITSVYTPYAESQETFDRMRNSVKFPKVTEFEYQDFHEIVDKEVV